MYQGGSILNLVDYKISLFNKKVLIKINKNYLANIYLMTLEVKLIYLNW